MAEKLQFGLLILILIEVIGAFFLIFNYFVTKTTLYMIIGQVLLIIGAFGFAKLYIPIKEKYPTSVHPVENMANGFITSLKSLYATKSGIICLFTFLSLYSVEMRWIKPNDFYYVLPSWMYHFFIGFLFLLFIRSTGKRLKDFVKLELRLKEYYNWAIVSVAVLLFALFLFFTSYQQGVVLPGLLSAPFYTYIMYISFGPIVEELFHRGYLQTEFIKTSQNKVISIGLSSLIFASTHIPKMIFAPEYVWSPPSLILSGPFLFFKNLPSPLSSFIFLVWFFLVGWLFGYIYEDTGSLTYPIIIHMGLNLAFVIKFIGFPIL